MMNRVHTVWGVAGRLAILSLATTAFAGDLNPPPGPIAPTGKTPILTSTTPGDVDSLFKITQPGAYVLRNNIAGVSGMMGIEIAANDVTVDLEGFALIGVAGSLDGLLVSQLAASNITIANGSIRGWGNGTTNGYGVDARNALGVSIRNVNASSNLLDGIRAGKGSIVTGCTATANGSDGIDVDEGSTVRNCTAKANLNDGIETDFGCSVIGCTASGNALDGIQSLAGSAITDCAAYDNGDDGIQGDENTTVTRCSGYLSVDDGIQVGPSSVVIGCSAFSNSDDGIQAGPGSTIANCSTSKNGGDGIVVSFGANVLNNNCEQSGAAGIHIIVSALGTGDTRIEANNVTRNLRGIDVDAAGNIIIKNTASGNGIPATDNYSILGIQTIGPIETLTGTIVSTSPWANFSY